MASDWSELTLEESMDAIIDYRGKTPKKTDSGIPLIAAKIIKSGRIETVNEFISEDDYDTWMRRGIPNEGDVVMTTEAPLGEIAQLDGRKIALAQRVITLRGKKDILDNTFLKYLMISEYVQHQLDGRGTGTTVKGIKQSELRKVVLKFPSFKEQKAIAHILGSLDDKIELNRQMNETLEAMAQALFKSWFVNFDPVIDNALAAGNAIPDELFERAEQRKAIEKKDNSDIQDLFPDEFEFTEEMGWIPKGWAVVELGDILERRNERVKAGGDTTALPYVPIDCISSKSLFLSESKNGNEAQSSLIKFHKDDFLFGAMRPYFHKVCIAPFYGTTRTTAFVLKPKLSFDYSFSLMQLFQKSTIDFATAGSVGSTIPYAKWDGSMSSIPITLPKEDIRKLFNNILRESFHTISIKYFENETLAKLRDTLLPKLISGELRITDADALVNETI